MIAARFLERSLGLVTTIVLARLLAPTDFGLVAMAMVFGAAADTLGAFGLDWALVRQPNVNRSHLDTAWTIRAAFGLLSLVVLAALSVPAAEFYREPRITAMILVLAVSVLVGSLENPGIVMYRREMDFTKEFQVRAIAKVSSAVIGVVAAVLMRSYWALLFGVVSARVASTAASYALHPHRPRISLASRRDLLGFSVWLWLANFLTFLRVKLVEMILGRVAGARDLGLFSVASELSQLASTELAAPINRALFSAYAGKGGEPVAVGRVYMQAAPVIWALTLPVVLGIYLVAQDAVFLVLGPQWTEAGPLLRVLALAGFFSLLSAGAIQVYWAIDKARLETAVELVWVLIMLGLVLTWTAQYGVIGAAWAVFVSNLVILPINLFLLRRHAAVSIRGTVARSWRIFAACGAMFWFIQLLSPTLPTPDSTERALVNLILVALVGASIYAVVLLGLWRITGDDGAPEALIVKRIQSVLGPGSQLGDPSSADIPVRRPGSKEPLVSVVIPAFNSERYIERAIRSVLEQSYRSIEVIVVDDGSSDRTASIVEGMGPSVILHRQENQGSAVARNRGLELARGDYVAFLDADDYWESSKIEKQVAHLQSCLDCVAVFCGKAERRSPLDTEGFEVNPARHGELSSDDRSSARQGWLYLDLLRSSVVHTSTILVRREAIDSIGRFDEGLRKGQDLDYWIRLSRSGRIHYLPEVLSVYRIHPQSVSHQAASTNYHAAVIQSAVRRYGRSDQCGARLGRVELAKLLAVSWREFSYQHFVGGSRRMSWGALVKSLATWPFSVTTWRLVAKMSLGYVGLGKRKSRASDIGKDHA